MQTPVDTDGPCVTARFAVVRALPARCIIRLSRGPAHTPPVPHALQGVLFNEGSYVVKSRHYNLIAFSVDISMLLKVLSSAGVNDADLLEVKLTQKAIQIPGTEDRENKPFLSFQAKVIRRPKAKVTDLRINAPIAFTEGGENASKTTSCQVLEAEESTFGGCIDPGAKRLVLENSGFMAPIWPHQRFHACPFYESFKGAQRAS